MNKFKKWLWKADEEGITNFDAITMFILNLLAWSLFIYFAMRWRGYI